MFYSRLRYDGLQIHELMRSLSASTLNESPVCVALLAKHSAAATTTTKAASEPTTAELRERFSDALRALDVLDERRVDATAALENLLERSASLCTRAIDDTTAVLRTLATTTTMSGGGSTRGVAGGGGIATTGDDGTLAAFDASHLTQLVQIVSAFFVFALVEKISSFL